MNELFTIQTEKKNCEWFFSLLMMNEATTKNAIENAIELNAIANIKLTLPLYLSRSYKHFNLIQFQIKHFIYILETLTPFESISPSNFHSIHSKPNFLTK